MQEPGAKTPPSWTPIPENWNSVRFDGTLPDVIYRYRQLRADTVEQIVSFEIVEEAVFLAGMGQLNDPDEGRIRWVLDGSEEDIYEFWKRALRDQHPGATLSEIRKEARERTKLVIQENRIVRPSVVSEFNFLIDNLVRVACFTTNSLSNSMWSHYGKWVENSGVKEHGGICIEYECGEAWRKVGLCPVSYSQGRPTVNMLAPHQEKAQQFAKALFSKDPSWSYEDEWRIVAFVDARPPFPDNLTQNSKLRFEGGVRAVMFGLNATDRIVQDVDGILRAYNRQVPLKRVWRHPSTQELYVKPI